MKNLIKKNQLMITALAIMLAIAGYLQFAGNNLDEAYLETDEAVQTSQTADAGDVITENYTAGVDFEDVLSSDLEALDALSAEGVGESGELVEIASLDSDVDIIMEDYLDEDMTVEIPTDGEAVAEVQPEEGEIPGEAVFTSADGIALLSEAKLLKEQVRARNKETLLEIINSDGLTEEQKQDAVNSMVNMTNISEKETAAEILLEAKGFSDAVVSINDNTVDVVINAASLTDVQIAQIEDIVKRKTEIDAENIVISTVVQ